MRLKTGLAIASAVALAVPTKGRGQIVTYNFGSSNSSSETLATMEMPSQYAATGLQTPGSLTVGTTTTPTNDDAGGGTVNSYWVSPSPNYLSVENTQGTGATNSTTPDSGYYVDFVITADPGYVIDPTSFVLTGGQGGGTASARSYYIFDNVDGLPSSVTSNNTSPATVVGATPLSVVATNPVTTPTSP
jgi:hypothetical protein